MKINLHEVDLFSSQLTSALQEYKILARGEKQRKGKAYPKHDQVHEHNLQQRHLFQCLLYHSEPYVTKKKSAFAYFLAKGLKITLHT